MGNKTKMIRIYIIIYTCILLAINNCGHNENFIYDGYVLDSSTDIPIENAKVVLEYQQIENKTKWIDKEEIKYTNNEGYFYFSILLGIGEIGTVQNSLRRFTFYKEGYINKITYIKDNETNVKIYMERISE